MFSRFTREMEATLDPSSPVLMRGRWRLTKLRAAVMEPHVFWVVVTGSRAEEISFKRLNSPTGRQGSVEERWSRGGSVVSDLRRNVGTVVSVGGCARMGVQVEADDAWRADEPDSYTC
ncbi:unnamed protein product [Brassica oleracea]